MMKTVLLTFLLFALGYLFFSVVDELVDKFIYKKKTVRMLINADDYKVLKKRFKMQGNGMTVEKYLQIHLKYDIKDLLESDV